MLFQGRVVSDEVLKFEVNHFDLLNFFLCQNALFHKSSELFHLDLGIVEF